MGIWQIQREPISIIKKVLYFLKIACLQYFFREMVRKEKMQSVVQSRGIKLREGVNPRKEKEKYKI